MTLIELLLALTATAFIGLAIASMIAAVSYGSQSNRELRQLTVKNKTLTTRITAAVRQAKSILASGDNHLVLWQSDLDDDGQPSLLELTRLDFDDATGSLLAYTPADNAPDTPYQLTDDFTAITDGLIGSAAFPAQTWASDVASWSIDLDQADPKNASLVSFRLMLEAGDLSDTVITAVALRN